MTRKTIFIHTDRDGYYMGCYSSAKEFEDFHAEWDKFTTKEVDGKTRYSIEEGGCKDTAYLSKDYLDL